MDKVMTTGTTTLAMALEDTVVLATERRVSMDHFIAHKDGRKLHKLDDYMAMTIAGLVGDAQVLVRYMRAELELFKLQRKMNMPVEAAATLLSNIMNQSKFYPYMVQLLLGGVDTKPHVFSVDAAGGSVEDKYVSTGSGSPFAYGVLEMEYDRSLKVDAAVNVAIRAITAAKSRDSASGGMIDVAVIDKSGYRDIPEEDILARMKKLKLSY